MQTVPMWLTLLCVLGLAGSLALADGGRQENQRDRGQEPPVKDADPDTKDKEQETKLVAAKVGQSAPDFELTDCSGKKHKLSDYKDKVVVLQWVNKECPWSVKAIPVIKDLQEKYAEQGTVWLGIESTHWRKAEDNQKYIKEKELSFPILMDNEGTVGRKYGAKTTPHIYVINKSKLVYMGGLHNNQHGNKKKSEVRNYLDEALAAVVAGEEVPVPETKPWGCSVKYKKKDQDKK